VTRCKMIYQKSRNQKQTQIAILRSDKVDFKIKLVRRHKGGNSTLIKGITHREDNNGCKYICLEYQCTQSQKKKPTN
jgi:hypothetical protein